MSQPYPDQNIYCYQDIQEFYKDETDTPLILFIIYCFFILCLLISVKTYKEKPPSGTTISSYSLLSMSSCFIIFIFGMISVYTEWAVMFTCVLIIMFFAISVLDPGLFIYPRTSTL
jgi:hypothetical protein